MQIISQNPFILIDGAHNPSGVRALAESLKGEFPNQKFSFIMAVMADKDYIEMAHIISPIAERIFTVTIDYSRALQAETLAKELNEIGIEAKACSDYETALNGAIEAGSPVIVMGSLYFIGEVLHDKDQTRGVCSSRA